MDQKSIEETVSFVEAKEMAREAMNRGSSTASVSTNRNQNRQQQQCPPKNTKTGRCKECKIEIESNVWSRRQQRMVERRYCSKCWVNKTKKQNQKEVNAVEDSKDEAGALSIIGGIAQSPTLPHYLFDSDSGWKAAKSMKHPTLQLSVSVNPEDYLDVGREPPNIKSKKIEVITDTGAQSCLWGLQNFLRCGFKQPDLLPVKHELYAANKEKIPILGAILLSMSGDSPDGSPHSAGVMVYVSPSSSRFFLSRDALIQLNVIPKDFPRLGAATTSENASIENNVCGCPK